MFINVVEFTSIHRFSAVLLRWQTSNEKHSALLRRVANLSVEQKFHRKHKEKII